MINFIKKMQTSKKITWLFIIVYLFGLLGTAIASMKGFDLRFIMDYLHQIVLIIVVSYFGSKTIENFEKIRISVKSGSEDSTNLSGEI